MSDEKDELDGSDWLSSQFNPTEQVPKQQDPQPSAEQVVPQPPTQQAPPHQPTAPPYTPFPAPAEQAAPATPAEPASAPDAASDFDWLLRPGGTEAAQTTAATPPTTPAPPVPPLVPPPEPNYATPTAPQSPIADEPTQPLSWDEFAASQQAPTAPPSSAPLTPPAFVDQPTEAYTVQPWQPTMPQAASPATAPPAAGPEGENDPTSAIDSLFGDHQFQAYEEVGVLKAVQSVPGALASEEPKEPRAPLSSTQKVLMGVAGGLIGVLILIGMFFLGQHIGSAQAAAPNASATGASTKAPTSAGTGGPAAPGVRAWSVLQGGECIQPFTSAWAATFTVVSCSADHDAEMVFKGKLPDASGTGYPTTTQFQTELTGLCSAPTAINYSVAKAVTDLQVSFSYPPSASKWLSGDRTYYCFVDRQSGGTLPGDFAVPAATN
jgi:hypothetical protein